MNATSASLHVNRLLSAYGSDTHTDFYAVSEMVHLKQGQLLYDVGERITHGYFPVTAVMSLMLLMENGATIEIASVGSEGFIGLPLIMGGDAMPSRVEVQTSGYAYKIKTADLMRRISDSHSLKKAMLLYAQTMMTFISQSSACHRHHSVLQQLCRWLLLAIDRTGSHHIHITQQLIANMLGVRREGITEALGKLEHLGIVRHVRGHISVVDRARLETSCCECYAIPSTRFIEVLDASVARRQVRQAAFDQAQPAHFRGGYIDTQSHRTNDITLETAPPPVIVLERQL